MILANMLNNKTIWSLVAVAFFALQVNAAQICSESDLMEAIGKVAHKSGLTKELDKLKGKWTSAVKMRADAEHPWTHQEGEDVFTVTADGHHLKHEITVAQEKIGLALITFDSQQKKYVVASCDSSGAPPVTTVGTFANGVLDCSTEGVRMTMTLRDQMGMVRKVSLLKKDTPKSREAREINILEVTCRREQAPEH